MRSIKIGRNMNNQQNDKFIRKFITLLKWGLLISIFLLCSWGIYPYIFKAITYILEILFDAKVHWERAPFLSSIFSIGLNIIFSWVVTRGFYNILRKKGFFYDVKWGKLFVVVFCMLFLHHLLSEIDNLVPKYKYEEYELEETSPLWPLTLGAWVLTGVIGWALWRHVDRYRKHWKCGSCGTSNSAWLDRCGNPKCEQPRQEKENPG